MRTKIQNMMMRKLAIVAAVGRGAGISGPRSDASGVGKNLSRCVVGRPGLLRNSRTGQPQFLSAADAEPAKRSKFSGVGGGTGEYIHAGVRKFVPRRHQPGAGGIFIGRPQSPPALQKVYRGPATDDGARKLAHQFADDIVGKLSGGAAGIAQTQIAFVSTKSGTKEIWAMDYDGSNQHQLTHLKSISLTPRWSPDATRIAFTCYVPFRGITSPQICIYSAASDRLISFPRYRGSNSSPAWSPDGTQLAFMSSQGGDPEIYISDTAGGAMKKVTFAAGVLRRRSIRRRGNKLFSSATARAIRFCTWRIRTGPTCRSWTCRTWATWWIRRGHRMGNCWHLVGDGRAGISISISWTS